MSGSATTVSYSDIQGGLAGTGNIDADPLFVEPVDPAAAPTSRGNLRLRPGSPAIDAGDNDAPGLSGILTDLDGRPRIVFGVVNMGAHQVQICLHLPLVLRNWP